MNSHEHQNRTRAAAGYATVLAAAALAVAPQVIWGNSCGHDFDFHLVSWFDALNSWRDGIPYPHWTPSANFGAGEPRFVFYSPLTWMLGAALATVLPWTLVPVVLTFILLAGTGLATRALAREALSEGTAALAGCIAIFSGYPLFTAYERSAFAELAGGAWIPLVLLLGLRTYDAAAQQGSARRFTQRGTIVALAIAVAGSWLSNPTVGVMACYLLAAVAGISAALQRAWWPALRAAAGATLGMGLGAVYLLPAAWEQRWVDIKEVTKVTGQTLENNWLFAQHANPGLALHDQILRTVSTIAVAMVAVALGSLYACALRRRLPGPRSFWIPLAIIPFGVLLLQFSFTDRLWNLLPDLRFLQFPWRWLLVLEAPMAVLLASALWPKKPAHRPRIAVFLTCTLAFSGLTAWAGKDLFQSLYPEDKVPSMLRVLQAGEGYFGTGEYEPIDSDIAKIPMNLPAACLASDSQVAFGQPNDDGDMAWDVTQGTCRTNFARAADSGPEHLRIRGTSPHSGFLIVRHLTYPAWRVTLNGRPIVPHPLRADGLMAMPIAQGPFELAVDWTTTSDVILARWLSGISVLALACLYLSDRRLMRPRLSLKE